MLTQLQQYLRSAAARTRTTSQVGPFLVTIDEDTTHPFLNYAIPDDGARPTPADVDALAVAFTARGRVPRLEYLDDTAPAVLAALEAAGFAVEARLQAMTAQRTAAVPLPAGYRLGAPDGDAGFAALITVQNAAYGAPGPPPPAQLRHARGSVDAGGVAVAITRAGETCGGGVATPPDGSGFTEVAGIAVAEVHRHRGLATALAADITRQALAAGVRTAFLTPADDDVARVYERAGFARVSGMLHVRRER